MPAIPVADQVRQLVRATFEQLGLAEGSLEETILIRNGCYCGRRFAFSGAHAIWFCEENQLKFYGEAGQVLRVIPQVDQELSRRLPLGDLAKAA